ADRLLAGRRLVDCVQRQSDFDEFFSGDDVLSSHFDYPPLSTSMPLRPAKINPSGPLKMPSVGKARGSWMAGGESSSAPSARTTSSWTPTKISSPTPARGRPKGDVKTRPVARTPSRLGRVTTTGWRSL